MTNGDFIRSMSDADIRENCSVNSSSGSRRAVAGAENIASTASRTG